MEKARPKARKSEREKIAARRAAKSKLVERSVTEITAKAETSPEHLGQMLMAASESLSASHTGKSALEAVKRLVKESETAPAIPASVTGKRVETLNRAELLSLSEQIMVDGSSLRQIYETHLIGERGLRRLVAEHLRGGDLRKALRLEVIEREIDFERDPGVRDMITFQAPAGGAAASPGKDALNELLERAAVSMNDSGEEAAFFKARALYESSQLQRHKQHRRVIDIALAGAIIILIALIAILLSRA